MDLLFWLGPSTPYLRPWKLWDRSDSLEGAADGTVLGWPGSRMVHIQIVPRGLEGKSCPARYPSHPCVSPHSLVLSPFLCCALSLSHILYTHMYFIHVYISTYAHMRMYTYTYIYTYKRTYTSTSCTFAHLYMQHTYA